MPRMRAFGSHNDDAKRRSMHLRVTVVLSRITVGQKERSSTGRQLSPL
jgi:hypothetical protein